MSHRLNLIDAIVDVATLGWTPADLMHIISPQLHPALYRAAPRIPSRVEEPALRHAWLMLGPPKDPFYDVRLEAGWLGELAALPYLKDTPALGAARPAPDSLQARVRRKIAALLAKAESTTFEAEAQALVARAQALRQAYRLSDHEAPAVGDVIARRVHLTAPYVKHKFSLLSAICAHNGVSAVLMNTKGLATIVGQAADLDHVEDLFFSLARQCSFAMQHGAEAHEARERGQTAAFRRSFQLAFASRISEILDAANSQPPAGDAAFPAAAGRPGSASEAAGAGTSGLPELRRRELMTEEALARLFPKLSTMSLNARHTGGVLAGVAAADEAHLSGDGAGLAPAQRALTA